MAEVNRNRIIGLETLAVSALLLPRILAPFVPAYGRPAHYSIGSEIISTAQFFVLGVVVLFIIWSSGDPLADFGIRKEPWPKTVIASFLLLAVLLILCAFRVYSYGLPTPGMGTQPAPSPLALLVSAINCLVASAATQLIAFSYLITRLRELTGSIYWAVAISTAVFLLSFTTFTAHHFFLELVTNCAQGLCLAAAFVVTRSIWPLIVSFALYSFAYHMYYLQFVTR